MRIAIAASLLVLAIAGFSATPAPAQEPVIITPEQVGQIFCIARTGNDMAPVEGLKSQDLRIAIEVAEQQNAVWEEANPGEKPPLGDGIPWQTAPDYADTCTVGPVTYEMDRATVRIDYAFTQYPQANFSDRLALKLETLMEGDSPRWRIDNVVYADDGDLRTVLLGAFAN